MCHRNNSNFSKDKSIIKQDTKAQHKENKTITSDFPNSTPLSELPINTEIEPSDNIISRV